MPVDLDPPNVFDPDCGCDTCVAERTTRAARALFVEGCEELWLDMLEADLSLDQDLLGGDGLAFGLATEVA